MGTIVIRKTKKIFENYFKQNLNEDMGAPDKDEIDAFFKPLKTSFKEFTHENKHIQDMARKLSNKDFVLRQTRFVIQTMVKDKDMLAIEQTIDSGETVVKFVPLQLAGKAGARGYASASAHRRGIMIPVLGDTKGHFDLETGKWICPGTEGYNEKLAHIPVVLSNNKKIKEHSGALVNNDSPRIGHVQKPAHLSVAGIGICEPGLLGSVTMSDAMIHNPLRIAYEVESLALQLSNYGISNAQELGYKMPYDSDDPKLPPGAIVYTPFQEVELNNKRPERMRYWSEQLGKDMKANVNTMMENFSFRQMVFELAYFKLYIGFLSVLIHELSHIFYLPTIDSDELLVPRYFTSAIFLGQEKGTIKKATDGHYIVTPEGLNPLVKSKGLKNYDASREWPRVLKDLIGRIADPFLVASGLAAKGTGFGEEASWNAEFSATSHTVKCLKGVAQDVEKLPAKYIKILSNDEDFAKSWIAPGKGKSNNKKRFLSHLHDVLNHSIVPGIQGFIKMSMASNIEYAEKGAEQAKVGGRELSDFDSFDQEAYDIAGYNPKAKDPVGGYYPDKLTDRPTKSAADKLYSCRDLLQADEKIKDEIHNIIIQQMQAINSDLSGFEPAKLTSEREYKKAIDNIKKHKERLKLSAAPIFDFNYYNPVYGQESRRDAIEKSTSIKGYPEYIDCLFKKQFGKLEEQTKVNKTLQEYILKNTGEKFEETPFGQIVADEVNYVVNNLPEIQLARDILGEQEAVAAGTKIAQALLAKLRQEMTALIPGLVKQEVEKMQAELVDDTQQAVASIETEEPAV